jgi:hypothetical protein
MNRIIPGDVSTVARSVILLFLFMAVPVTGQEPFVLVSDRSVILNDNQAVKDIIKPCSRPGPPAFQSSWPLTRKDARELEVNLPKISRLGEGNGNTARQIKNIGQYHRQYVGIVIDGRRLIYINAFSSVLSDALDAFWRNKIINVCDGGEAFWGAVYDPLTHTFSHLAINGVG